MTLLTCTKLSKERRIIGLGLLSCIALPFFIWNVTAWKYQETFDTTAKIQESCYALQKTAEAQSNNRQLLAQLRNKESLFLQHHIEPYPLLQQELKERKSDIFSMCLPLPRDKKDRLHFISSGENKLSFYEGKVQQSSLLKETLEIQTKSVEMDSTDLEHLLLLLEGSGEGQAETIQEKIKKRPLLLIESAELERKNRADRDVWAVKLRILKRECINK